jgi:hypothetical protein
MKSGIHKNLSMEAYHGHQGSYSKSSLVTFREAPNKLLLPRDEKKKDHFELGTAGHTAILQRDEYFKSVKVPPPEILGKNGARSTKAFKEWAEENKDYTLLTQGQHDQVVGMYESVLKDPRHSEARALLTGGISEASVFWYEHFAGQDDFMISVEPDYDKTIAKLLMKCRPDHLPGNEIVVDLKTGPDASPEAFGKKAYNLKYHWSAALTTMGLTRATGRLHSEYIFVVVETTPPHNVGIYRTPQALLQLGIQEVKMAMEDLAECVQNNNFPGLPNEIQDLQFPAWAIKED